MRVRRADDVGTDIGATGVWAPSLSGVGGGRGAFGKGKYDAEVLAICWHGAAVDTEGCDEGDGERSQPV